MSVTAAQGFRAAGVCASLKASGRPDLALVVNDGPLDVAAGVFTTNRVVAAPVTYSRAAVADGSARAVILNSGCANACTGAQGSADTAATAARTAELLGLPTPTDVLVCSTGVIGHNLDMPALLAGAAAAARDLAPTPRAGHDAAEAIMTTDTVSKEEALTLTTADGATWRIGGMIKGVGMLAPGLATMLCVLTTDAVVDAAGAQDALARATARTVNRISSDGCMSTNDTVLLLASGASGAAPGQDELETAVTEVLGRLGRRLVADAEGATHDIAITVSGAVSEAAAEAAARTVASSNLLKCAVAGEDPNWGRVLSQLGTVPAEVCPFDPDEVDVAINGVTVFRHGGLGQDPADVDMTPRETRIDITLSEGGAAATVWTNDLTHGYVTINADYHT
ncbi:MULTISPECIES: bifunctional glutamate N-acetyltransferase/amino-acid acetyltransferase ArgJ [unclassified Actinomyces]|uniref:bifunctional glutamate N-acetyltransferase/amino-acid acetyltransferase ArgJ n=1 Tax=unclassified Actinomyces TaxID=2609248 RepID=UPI002017C3A5|nr:MULTISPECIES: bifunctional glutamate N-acetyltransferase/amino-acid acetyltransferase ArgJ [unclassified Actinomyces]MCL3778604.1 bifunctional glutamate N-acetyltransferase/amino-acid acetyltransferase ArgJ [Actinomyces sp. AC-20-1]MCL3790345.1 bifunctional glutamate N-acetyltransferase/amino-acid acetyltransferase ArgJ [Actinomyces sp. 187325]MCL3793116.1 bifunctional glutamate N-acetyltransferase/amino-acid acetyltransferase ArgJ [Actinomyces sp. 186855]MCL3795126.1 bifunctional glutamate 